MKPLSELEMQLWAATIHQHKFCNHPGITPGQCRRPICTVVQKILLSRVLQDA